ncbi:hypothetical protein Atc_m113 (plasmid) [Acidithiobacillus caldus SM-1]|uniref:Uncharacterized protein n=1 Tax=Acidithiobacillus caldus (strain SM-1) TaxID=990288 RepID=F9ZUT0_ACICS|nr:hypothetical protein Atc_m113 [Acidithiobacillus caldus SM-1]
MYKHGCVDVFIIGPMKRVRLNANNPIFTVNYAWDHIAERKTGSIERTFQQVVDNALCNPCTHILSPDACVSVSAFYGLLINREHVADNPRNDAPLNGIIGLSDVHSQDTYELYERLGIYSARPLDTGGFGLLGRTLSGLMLFKGMDQFLMNNPNLVWAVCRAPENLEFIVPDRFAGIVDTRFYHHLTIPIGPSVALVADPSFVYHKQLAAWQLGTINAMAKAVARRYYFSRDLDAAISLRRLISNWLDV